MGSGIGYTAAFLGGLLALLSPCSALLLPSFFAYSFDSPGKLVSRTSAFYLGLCTTLVPLGAAGSLIGAVLTRHRELIVTIGGWTIIALGVLQILGRGFQFGFAQRWAARHGRSENAAGVYLLGMVYGLSGFCTGPILGSILTVAALSSSPLHGASLLAVYALGMAMPLFALALLWDRCDLGRRRWLRGRAITVGRVHLHTTSLISGAFFILLGVLFLTSNSTSALLGSIGTDREFTLETKVLSIGDAIPDTTLLLLLGVVALAWVSVRLLRGNRTEAGARD
ncbi:cytochrome c biogenesis CcdA family protein [Nocardia huaxiensis]|uniref:Cytochrome c biogenesis protein CcdA n=1 Tax=Nocardia huaxiensis TaxID=2755382 RepID=A0A7D6ZN49_9NOCA|nr:cytochrome c biogenesis CcdA family protein [Nocardia huaxiensis]QLY33720.1 cytochrome c biogenesis protein CcdA [Nocardia huaxiensis]UFS99357.1 cytochrome c biogenesis CcdA family protein [Nocardia huaxiensis]